MEPKYKIGDKVRISLVDDLNNGEHIAIVQIVDRNGTFENPDEVSYDVMLTDYRTKNNPDKPGECLLKHCPETILNPF